jgi:hypothetical protein
VEKWIRHKKEVRGNKESVSYFRWESKRFPKKTPFCTLNLFS